MALNITPPTSINHLFGNWLNGIFKLEKVNIKVGICALMWSIWYVRNEFIFNKSKFPSFLQVIPLTTHWIHVVFSPVGGATSGHGYWVQPFGNGCSGYLQPIRVAV
jgi:hypothetical protein